MSQTRTLNASEQRAILQQHAEWSVVKGEIEAILNSLVAANSPYAATAGEVQINCMLMSTYIKFSAGWGTDATVTVHYNKTPATAGRKKYSLITLSAEVCWSSTNRTVANATAALAVYRRAVEFAATMESIFSHEYWMAELTGEGAK
ncbi:hypothetical protein UFOVP1229_57 [uncultured Caudovirales phage]|uniref:Uncharacterized protein n=1 Tax=uncultured Caudovirales phage TaxID=2100421 RepID=A0A6J5R3W3_9CAUD|nr:hypothetical protein UFOVP1229_57 [uncultured Caudovirales phage]